MKKPELILVTGSKATHLGLLRQLKEYLPAYVKLRAYSFEEGVPEGYFAEGGVLLLSGESFEKRLEKLGCIRKGQKIVVAEKRIINIDRIEEIVHIPMGTEILVVNDTEAAAMDAIVSLKEIGFDSFQYVPFWQGATLSHEVAIAVSAGENHLVPESCTAVYDIGIRLLSFSTLAEIWKLLELPLEVLDQYLDKYVTKLIAISRQISDVHRHADSLSQKLLSLVHSIDGNLLMYDVETFTIGVCNKNMRMLLGMADGNMGGRSLYEISDSEELLGFLKQAADGEEKMINVRGRSVLASKSLVDETNAVVILKTTERIQNENSKVIRDLARKGFYAKYTLEDILGTSPAISDVKRKAERLAKTDLSILIEGESGTGKELFASAIHRASARKDFPYVAVNFSALQDSLMESELFGYEEGAFTGAKKGGKAGIFEMANGGTIFLDEIGDISMKMQIGLLRVLQEKEVMRVGGKEIKYVDVRIIAATNQNLQEKVKNGQFREDLYYRLKIGYLKLPPLRNRLEDIPVLAEAFLMREGAQAGSLSDEFLEKLKEHGWNGNVRELKNTITYIYALRDEDGIRLDDLPFEESYSVQRPSEESEENVGAPSYDSKVGEAFALQRQIAGAAKDYEDGGAILGREALLNLLHERGYGSLTMYGLRQRIIQMEQKGLLKGGRGKAGIRLTEQGRDWIDKN